MPELLILWATFEWPIFFFVTLCWTIIDGLYIRWMYLVTKQDALKSAMVGVWLALLSALSVIGYTSNPLYIIGVMIGSFLGTYVEVAREKSGLTWKGLFIAMYNKICYYIACL